MNTKLLMSASAAYMVIMGTAFTFTPEEILEFTGEVPSPAMVLALQLAGALYFGFAMTNWMAKTVLIGGIYSRPLAIGNFAQFLTAGLTLLKATWNASVAPSYLYILTCVCMVFAILFGYVAFSHPVSKNGYWSKPNHGLT